MPPPLLILADEAAYQAHFVAKYCAGPLMTHDGIPVYFKRHAFYHAFFESVVHKDDTFSRLRAERIDWIEATLTDALTERFQGYLSKTKQPDPTRRVELRFENFIVVLIIGLAKDGTLKGEFLTCYPVNNNRLLNVQKAPWNRQECENALQKK